MLAIQARLNCKRARGSLDPVPAEIDPRYRQFGQTLQKAREAASLGQRELGKLVGLSRASISNIEGGRQRVPLHLAFDLAAALRVELGTLWRPKVVPLPMADNASEQALTGQRENVRAFVERVTGDRDGDRA